MINGAMKKSIFLGVAMAGLFAFGMWLYTTDRKVPSIDEPVSGSPAVQAMNAGEAVSAETRPASDNRSMGDEVAALSYSAQGKESQLSPHGSAVRERLLENGHLERITLHEPDDLPYRIRRLEHIRMSPDGGEQILQREEMVADHILLQFQPDTNEEELQELLARHGAKLGRRMSARGLYRVEIVDADGFEAAPALVRALSEYTGVLRYVEPDYIVRTQVAFNYSRTLISYGNSWFGEQQNSRLEFNAVAGTTYIFLVNGHNHTLTEYEAGTNTGRIRLNLAMLEPPANAFFDGATAITDLPYHVIQPTFGAIKESGEPNHGGINGGRSLWWKWTATESGPFVVSTAGNLYDDYHARHTGLGVYTGSSVDNLTTIASDQNGAGMNTGANTWSSLTFDAIEGTTYFFGADAVHAGNLSFLLTRPAPNDRFADATEMAGSRWVTYGHHLETGFEPGEPRIDGGYSSVPDNNFRSIWYRWTAPVSGEITLDTMGSESVNLIGVFVGEAVDNLTSITPIPRPGGNPFNGSAQRRARQGNNRGPATFMAEAGTTYYISVQGAGFVVPSSGPIRLELVGPPAIPFAPRNFIRCCVHCGFAYH